MLGVIRKQLRLVRYYSAPRRRDRRAVIFERTTLAALVLCIPVALVVDRTVRRATANVVVDGTLLKDEAVDGTYRVSVMDDTGRLFPLWPEAIPVADFDLTLNIWNYGWPITTSRARAPAQVTFTPFGRTAQTAAALAADPAVRRAFEDVMRERGPQMGAVAFDRAPFSWDEGERAHSPIGWIYAVCIWFALLTAVIIGPMVLFELLARLSHAAREVRSASRRDRGLCTQCGYNLTGNEFSERCPECGTLV